MPGIVAAIVIFYGIVQSLNYMYVDDSSSVSREQVVWHEFYEEKGRINNVYLGSSHVYYNINPVYLDNINEQFNFNLSTPSQLPNGTFHLLKEADRYNELSHVYVEFFIIVMCEEIYHLTMSEFMSISKAHGKTVIICHFQSTSWFTCFR